MPTCFANTLTHLTRLKAPIREVKSTDDLFSEEDAKNAPREVMRLVNHMMSGDGDVVSVSRITRITRDLVSASAQGRGLTPNFYLFVDSLACSLFAEIQNWWKSYERFDRISTCHPPGKGAVVPRRPLTDALTNYSVQSSALTLGKISRFQTITRLRRSRSGLGRRYYGSLGPWLSRSFRRR